MHRACQPSTPNERPRWHTFAFCLERQCKVFVQPIFSLFLCKNLIYVHTQKSTIPALFWTVLVSVDQEFL